MGSIVNGMLPETDLYEINGVITKHREKKNNADTFIPP